MVKFKTQPTGLFFALPSPLWYPSKERSELFAKAQQEDAQWNGIDGCIFASSGQKKNREPFLISCSVVLPVAAGIQF